VLLCQRAQMLTLMLTPMLNQMLTQMLRLVLMLTMVTLVLVMVDMDMVDMEDGVDTIVHTATADTGEERKGKLRPNLLLKLIQMLRQVLMLTMVTMVLVMVDGEAMVDMVDMEDMADTIVHIAMDTGEERKGMLRLNQLLPLNQMLKLMLMLTMVTMVLAMVDGEDMVDMEDMADTIVHTATDTGEEKRGRLSQLLNLRLSPTMDTDMEDIMVEDGEDMAAITDPMAMDTGEGSKRFSLHSWQGVLALAV